MPTTREREEAVGSCRASLAEMPSLAILRGE
jgi:hypothetical protein